MLKSVRPNQRESILWSIPSLLRFAINGADAAPSPHFKTPARAMVQILLILNLKLFSATRLVPHRHGLDPKQKNDNECVLLNSSQHWLHPSGPLRCVLQRDRIDVEQKAKRNASSTNVRSNNYPFVDPISSHANLIANDSHCQRTHLSHNLHLAHI